MSISTPTLLPLAPDAAPTRAAVVPPPGADVPQAYAYCREVARVHARTFYLGAQLLPHEKRAPIYAIYAFCRYVDDLVDRGEDKLAGRTLDPTETLELVGRWRRDLEACYAGRPTADNPILVAWMDTLSRFAIPHDLPFELIDGVMMDLERQRYETFDELTTYCYKVASVVGLMTSEVFGYAPGALPHAVDLGIAMQLTNILRDIGEDGRNGRIYLPQEDLRRFGLTDDDVLAGRRDRRMREMLRFQIARARDFYDRADRGIPMLSPDARLAVHLSRVNYSQILKRIEANDYDVFSRRAYVPMGRKILNLPWTWLRNRRLERQYPST